MDLPEPWETVEDADMAEYRHAWEVELVCELGPGHLLFGQTPRLICRRLDCDDALFQLEDGRVAEVHLTWSGRREANSVLPETRIFSSLGEWHGIVSGKGA